MTTNQENKESSFIKVYGLQQYVPLDLKQDHILLDVMEMKQLNKMQLINVLNGKDYIII